MRLRPRIVAEPQRTQGVRCERRDARAHGVGQHERRMAVTSRRAQSATRVKVNVGSAATSRARTQACCAATLFVGFFAHHQLETPSRAMPQSERPAAPWRQVQRTERPARADRTTVGELRSSDGRRCRGRMYSSLCLWHAPLKGCGATVTLLLCILHDIQEALRITAGL